ncbi:hypothetical protein Bpfe_001180 [Biomphalaria pfeifferi]|uniref:Uncharacterized protein n=1 Tax=Biomphalaria pfeifferi TaxID=112525 RepID=A0AAD8CC74_BIOPF|nr:hypothetical protein Bpfe_001180 [Biomphalaria pfeifferi]
MSAIKSSFAKVSPPCLFNMTFSEVQSNRYRELSHKLKEDLKQEAHAEETVWLLDLLTWVHFKLMNYDEALQFNNESLTKNLSLVCIGNRIHVLKKLGRDIETDQYMQFLTTPSENDTALAKAQQAYCCLRLGGTKNLQKAINNFEDIIKKLHGSYRFLSLFYLGLSYRRLVHPNTLSCTQYCVSIEDYVKSAQHCFYEVIEKSGHPVLVARAYSELVVLYHDASSILGKSDYLWNDQSIETLIDKALTTGGQDAKALTACGRILCLGNEDKVRKGIDLLTKALKLKESTTAYHNLAVGYIRLEEYERHTDVCQEAAKVTDKVDAEDAMINKAIENLKTAIKISDNYNLPATFDLGKVFKSLGNVKEALAEFNKVVESDAGKDGSLFLIIDSLEQAGLCLMELHDMELDPQKKNDYMSRAESKLIEAVGLQTQLVSSVSALKRLSLSEWKALKTLKSKYEGEDKSPIVVKKLVHLLGVALEHQELLKVIKDLSNDEILHSGIATQALESYLAEGEVTNAYGFLNMLNTLPVPVVIDAELTLKVQLNMAANCLGNEGFNPRYIFKAIFDHYIDVNKPADVLILYDDSHDTEEETSHVTCAAKQLYGICSNIFSLETSINIKTSCLSGPEVNLQLEEMKKCKLLLLLLGNEPRDRHFKAILEFIPDMIVNENLAMKSVRVVTVNTRVSPPTWVPLSQCSCVEEFLPQKEHVRSAQTDRCTSSDQIQDITHSVENKTLVTTTETALLWKEGIQKRINLFCFLIGHSPIHCHSNISL